MSSALMGIGFGLAFSAMSALIVAAVPPSQTGVASGMNANIRTIGSSGTGIVATTRRAPVTSYPPVMATRGAQPTQDARRAVRRDVERNYQRVLDAAREVFAESGAEAGIEEIAARAGVGIGTVYRRFASKDALIDELLRLSIETLLRAAEAALSAPPEAGLEQYLGACGEEFASHARYADLLLTRSADPAARARLREALEELTARARGAGAVAPSVTAADVTALIWGMRGLVQATPDLPPDAWQRYLSVHLAGLRSIGS